MLLEPVTQPVAPKAPAKASADGKTERSDGKDFARQFDERAPAKDKAPLVDSETTEPITTNTDLKDAAVFEGEAKATLTETGQPVVARIQQDIRSDVQLSETSADPETSVPEQDAMAPELENSDATADPAPVATEPTPALETQDIEKIVESGTDNTPPMGGEAPPVLMFQPSNVPTETAQATVPQKTRLRDDTPLPPTPTQRQDLPAATTAPTALGPAAPESGRPLVASPTPAENRIADAPVRASSDHDPLPDQIRANANSAATSASTGTAGPGTPVVAAADPQLMQRSPGTGIELGGLEPDPAISSDQVARSSERPAQAQHALPTLTMLRDPGVASRVLDQVAARLNVAGNDRFEIQLDPPELGRITVRILAGETGATAQVIAERPEVLDFMRRNESLLAREFGNAGFSDMAFDFSDRPENADKYGDPSEPGDNTPANLTYVAENGIKTSALGPDGRLDIRL